MAYKTTVETNPGGREIVRLLDDATGASAAVMPSFGFNLFDLQLPVHGKPTAMIFSAADFATAPPSSPARNGTPILFPYPNRVREGKFTFEGKSYELPITNGTNAIHGFAMSAAWDVVEHGAGKDGAFVVGRYHLAAHSPANRAMWPTDAILQVRYALAGRRMTMTTTVTNPTEHDLPYGFGIHPYFHIPFASDGDAAKTLVVMPSGKTWVLDQFLPTGEIKDVDPAHDFRKGQPRAGLKLDDVFTGLDLVDGRSVCRLVDLAAKAEFRIISDAHFRELVAFTPGAEPQVIAIEPYTQTTDAINLQAKGVDAGLRVLKHGESETLMIAMETADVA